VNEINFNILDSVMHRLDTNRNFLAIIAGDTGSGKSMTALKIGELLDSSFGINNVAFTPSELVALIKNVKPKSVIVMDEAGVSYGARDFMKRENKALGGLFQMFRFKLIALIWTLPDVTMLDINARRLMHTYIETIGVDYRRNLSEVKWFSVKINRWTGEVKHIYPRIATKHGYSVVKVVRFPKPSEALINAYEKKKQKAFDNVMEYCERVLSSEESPKKINKKPKGKKVEKDNGIPDYMGRITPNL